MKRNVSGTKKKKSSDQVPDSPFRAIWHVSPGGYRIEQDMDSDLNLFYWDMGLGKRSLRRWDQLPLSGYSKAVTQDGPWLVEPVEDPMAARGKDYNPMRLSALHRKFALIEPTPGSVLEFANEYGMLGRVVRFDRNNPGGAAFEPINFWLMHVGKIRRLLKIWDACKDSATEQEAKVEIGPMIWPGFGASIDHVARKEVEKGSSPYPFYPYSGFSEADDYVSQMSEGVGEERRILDDFSYKICGLLLLREELNLELAVGVKASINPIPGTPVYMVPKDLLGAIYALFAQETIGSTRASIRCAGCGKWFFPKDARKKTCSAACKQRYYRMRNTNEEDKTHGTKESR